MKRIVVCFVLTCTMFMLTVQAQNVGIGTTSPEASSKLEISSNSGGLLIPRITEVQRSAIMSPATGLLVFVTTDSAFYYFDGSEWVTFDARTSMLVDADNDTKVQVEKNANENIIRFDMAGTERFRMNSAKFEVLNSGKSVFIGEGAGANDDLLNKQNVFIGYNAGNTNTVGFNNTASGYKSMFSNLSGGWNTASGWQSLYSNTVGSGNSAHGFEALFSNEDGAWNTASGVRALYLNTEGTENTANGVQALFSNTVGIKNTASGFNALFSNTIGNFNTATGFQTMLFNKSGYDNTAYGVQSLYLNDSGYRNTASGNNALYSNTIGYGNSAYGSNGLFSNISGKENTASGWQALYSNTEGDDNTASGLNALYFNTTGSGNTAIGELTLLANTKGDFNTALGSGADVVYDSLTNATAIGRNAKVSTSNSLVLGGTGAFAVNVGIGTTAPAQVLSVNGDASKVGGGVWLTFSDRRVKKDIRKFDDGLDVLMQIDPVYFRYNGKAGYEDDGKEYVGVIAQDIQQCAPYMVETIRQKLNEDDKEQTELLMYDGSAISYILVNAMQEQQRIIEAQQEKIDALWAKLDAVSQVKEELAEIKAMLSGSAASLILGH